MYLTSAPFLIIFVLLRDPDAMFFRHFSDLDMCVSSGSETDLKTFLATTLCTIDQNILQRACERTSDGHLTCLLNHMKKRPVSCAFSEKDILIVHRVETFDHLKKHGISCNNIVIDWNKDFFSSVVTTQNLLNWEHIVNEYCNITMSSHFLEPPERNYPGMIQDKNIRNLLFACISHWTDETAENVCTKMIQSLLSCNGDLINIQNEKGQTPIMFAACLEKKDVVLLLAQHAPDISIASNDGKLLIDFIYNWEDVIQELMKVNIHYCIS